MFGSKTPTSEADKRQNNLPYNLPQKKQQIEWWRVGSQYNFDIQQKLKKQGCRSVYRNIIECKNGKTREPCQMYKEAYNQCMKIYQYLMERGDE